MTQLSPAGLLASTLLIFAIAAVVSGPPSPDEDKLGAYQNDINMLWRTSTQYVQKEGLKQKPSSDCCRTMQAAYAHKSCVCDYLGSHDARDKLSMEKVLHVTKQCSVTVPACCGSEKF